jgi:UDP-glucose 4-epimerase
MRALVTGGAGFIGSTLVDRLISDGHDVLVVDDLSRGRMSNLSEAGQQVKFVQQDIQDPDLVRTVKDFEPATIFHLAAQIDVRASVADPARDARINILGTINLAEAARVAGVRKIVFTSSGGSIYGTPSELPVSEQSPIDPRSPYAVSKASGELYLNAFSSLHGVQCTHLALANVYGPRQDPHGEAGVVAIFIERLLGGQPTQVFGDGSNTRDYVYSVDVADAFIRASAAASDRRRYNIGTGVETTDRELHSLIARSVGAQDQPKYAPARLGDVARSAIDSSRARRELQWAPLHDLSAGVMATVEYFRRRRRLKP